MEMVRMLTIIEVPAGGLPGPGSPSGRGNVLQRNVLLWNQGHQRDGSQILRYIEEPMPSTLHKGRIEGRQYVLEFSTNWWIKGEIQFIFGGPTDVTPPVTYPVFAFWSLCPSAHIHHLWRILHTWALGNHQVVVVESSGSLFLEVRKVGATPARPQLPGEAGIRSGMPLSTSPNISSSPTSTSLASQSRGELGRWPTRPRVPTTSSGSRSWSSMASGATTSR